MAAAVLCFERLEPEPEVVAEPEALEHASREPAGHVVEHRDPLRALAPVTKLELVELVAGLAAEQFGQIPLSAPQEVHDDSRRAADHVERAVLLRDADEKAWRVDARLRREADQAAAALTVGRERGDDEHRRVEPADEFLECLFVQAAKSVTRSRTPWSVWVSRRLPSVFSNRQAGVLSLSIDALKRLTPRPRASSASRIPSFDPIPCPCIESATVTATSAVSGSSLSRT